MKKYFPGDPLVSALELALAGVRVNRLEVWDSVWDSDCEPYYRLSCFGPAESLVGHGLMRAEHLELPPCGVCNNPRNPDVPAARLHHISRGKTGYRVELLLSEENMLTLAGEHTVAPLWRQIIDSPGRREDRRPAPGVRHDGD